MAEGSWLLPDTSRPPGAERGFTLRLNVNQLQDGVLQLDGVEKAYLMKELWKRLLER